ncbi:MAG: GAF domain-containing protein, partial [Planctomycetota bacterium]
MTTESSGETLSGNLFPDANVNMRISPGAELPKQDSADLADPGLAALGADLRAVATTIDTRNEVISHFLQLGVSRSNMLSTGWIELPKTGKPVLIETQFSNPSLNNNSIRAAMTSVAAKAIAARKNTVTPVENIRGASIVSVPLYIDGETAGAYCGMVHDNRVNCSEALLVCQMIATHYDLWRARDEFTRLTFEVRSASTVLELIGKAQSTESTGAACYSIAGELKRLFGCEFVAVGLRRRNKIGSSLMAISSSSDFERESKTTLHLCSAFDEAVIRERYTAYPPSGDDHSGTPIAHEKLARHMRCDAAISVPVRNQDDEIVGAVTLLGSRELGLNPSTRHLIHALEHPLGGTVEVVKRAEGGWWQKIQRKLAIRKNLIVSRAIAVASALVIGAMFVPVSYRVPCQCTAEPDVRRVSVAPYEGLLESTFVEPGDVVRKDQLIARMDGSEIRLEQTAIEFDRSRARRQQEAMMAGGTISDAMLAELEYHKLDQRKKL